MAFDVAAARRAGYSDQEIAEFLGKQQKFDTGAALKAGYSPADLVSHLSADKPAAPFSLKDTGIAAAQGFTGALKGVASAFGADNVVAEKLGSVQQSLSEAMSPERKAEQQRRALLERQAAKSGSITQELGAFLGGVKEAPIQSIAQGVSSSIPAIAAGLATAVAGAPAAIAGAVAVGARFLFGAVQGAGEVKGDIMEAVERELRASGMSASEARKQAVAAQEYLGQNAGNILSGAGLGAVASGTGVENVIGRALTKQGAAKAGESLAKRVVVEGGKEAFPEGAQGGQGQYAQNVALTRAGIDTPAFEGVLGSAARDAAVGALTGASLSPIGRARGATTQPGGPSEAEQRLQAKKEQEALARADALAKEQAAQNLRDTTARHFEGPQATLFKPGEIPKPMLPEKTLEVVTPEGVKSSVLQRAAPETPAPSLEDDRTVALDTQGKPIPKPEFTREEATAKGVAELPLETARKEEDVITERGALTFELESLKGDRTTEARERRAEINDRIAELDIDLARRAEDRGPTLEGKGQGELFGAPPPAPKPAKPTKEAAPAPEPTAPAEQLDMGIDALKDYAELVQEREMLRALPKEQVTPELQAYMRKLDQDIRDRVLYDLDLAQQKRARDIEADKNKLREEELAAQSAFSQPAPAPTPAPAPAPVAAAPTPAPAPQVEEQPVPEPTVRQAPTLQTVAPQLDLGLRSLLGIGPTARLFRPDGGIVGKDISDPAQAAEVKATLETYLERPTLSPNIVERINTFLQRPEFQGVESGRPEQPKAPAPPPAAPSVPKQRAKPRGGKPSVAVSGEPAGAEPAEPGAGAAPTTGEPERPVGRGLVPIEQPAGEGADAGKSKPAPLKGRKVSGVAGATEASKPINKAIDKVDDYELDPETKKGTVVQYARKLHREGLIDDISMNAIETMSKDKDMGAQDVIDELKLALEDTRAKLAKGEPLTIEGAPPEKKVAKAEERRSVQPTIGKVQQDLGSLQTEIANGTGLLAGLLRRLLKSGKVRLEAISPTGDATVGGLYDGNTVVLYASGIPKGNAVAVALHEVGAHLGLKNLLGEKQYKELSQRIIDMATSKTASTERALAQRALRRIPKEDIARGEEVYRDEALAYFAEELVKAEISGELAKAGPLRVMYNRIRAAVQATFNRLFDTNFGVNTFTPDQIGFLIKGAMGVEAFTNTKAGSPTPTEKKLSVAKGQEEPNPEVRFSRTMPQEDIDTINKLSAASPLPPEQEANVIKQGYEGVRKAQKVAGLVPWLRQHLVDKYASVLSKTSQYFSQGVRDSFGNLNNEVLLRQADDHAKVTQDFLHMGGIDIDKDGAVKITKEKESVVGVFKKVIDFGKTNGMDPKQSMAFFSTLLEGNRLYGLEKQGFKVSMTREQMADAKRILDNSPDAKAILDDLNTIRERAIKLMVATGRISQQQADAWNSAKDYVPFNRIFDEDEKAGTPYVIRGKGIAVLRNIPALVGSYGRPVENVLDAFAERMGYMISESLRNQASVKTLEIMRLAGYAGSVPSKEASKNPGLVVPRLYKDGKPVFYEVQNPYDLAAFQQIPESTNGVINAMAAVSRVLRLSITAMPPFAAKQVLDDAQRAMFYSGVERPVVVAIKTLYNFPRIFFGELTGRKSPAVREMEAYGIVGDYDSNLVRPTQDMRYELGIDARSTGANIIHFLEKITKASDLAARTAVFEETMRETNGDAQLAQTRARELINFSRRGSSGTMRTLTKVVPFFNAYAQGMDVLYRAASGIDSSSAAERSAARKLFYSRMGIMMGMGFLYAAMMSGEDDYEGTTEEVRDNNWIFPGGYKLPVPKELGFIFKSIPERLVEYFNRYGTDEEQAAGEAFKSLFKSAFSAYTSPSAVPSTIKPFFEHLTNYSFFLQRELVPSSMKERPAEFQYTSDTSELAKFVSKQSPVDIAPIVIDNYLRGFFGMAASTGLLMTDAVLNPTRPDRPIHQLPFASIVRYDTIGGREKAEFYDLREKVMKARNGYNDLLKKDPAEAEAFAEKNYALIDAAPEVNRLLTELSNLRKERVLYEQATAEVVGEMSGTERRQMIDEIRKEEKSVLSDIRQLKKFIRDEQK